MTNFGINLLYETSSVQLHPVSILGPLSHPGSVMLRKLIEYGIVEVEDSIHCCIVVVVMPGSRVRASPGELFYYQFENIFLLNESS